MTCSYNLFYGKKNDMQPQILLIFNSSYKFYCGKCFFVIKFNNRTYLKLISHEIIGTKSHETVLFGIFFLSSYHFIFLFNHNLIRAKISYLL